MQNGCRASRSADCCNPGGGATRPKGEENMAVAELAGGAAGAVALTLVHEAARRTLPDAPRMDVLGERAIAAGVRAAGGEPPPEPQLHRAALAGDLVANTAYYSL